MEPFKIPRPGTIASATPGPEPGIASLLFAEERGRGEECKETVSVDG